MADTYTDITLNGRSFYWTTTDNSTADSHYLYSYGYPYWPQDFVPSAPDPNYQLQELLAQIQKAAQPKKEEPPMRGLFIVYIVDPETDEVTTSPAIVAVDANSAKLKVLLKAGLARDVDEYNIIVTQIGNVNARKRVQEVKVVKEG